MLPLILLCTAFTCALRHADGSRNNNDTSNVTYLNFIDFVNARSRRYEDHETFLTNEDFEAGRRLLQHELYPVRSKGISSKLYTQKHNRGDIVLKDKKINSLPGGDVRRNGVRPRTRKWPGGKIPYTMSTGYDARERAILARAIDEYHKRTCVRFVRRQKEVHADYVHIGKVDGCYSDVGRAGGRQDLSLDDGCLEYDTAIHELMHAVGFYHEHERWDRDKFIDILWENIDRDAYDQFGRVDLYESSYYEQPYDYQSILHYDRLAFSKNGHDTIWADSPHTTSVIGTAIDFSTVDIAKINTMYKCTGFVGTSNNGNNGSNGMKPPPTPPSATTRFPQPWRSTSTSTRPTTTPWSLDSWHTTTTTGLFGDNGNVWLGTVALPSPQPGTGMGTQTLPSVGQVVGDGSGCQDTATLCYRWLDRCTSFFFEKIMRQFCARSCGFCKPVGRR